MAKTNTLELPGDFFNRLAREGFSQNPHAELAVLRNRAHDDGDNSNRSDGGGPVRLRTGEIVVGRHADVDTVLRDPRFEKLVLPSPPIRALQTTARMFLLLNPPEHARLRGAVSGFFTAKATEQRRTEIDAEASAIMERLVDSDAQRGRTIDLVSEFAYPLSLTLMCRWLGVDDDQRADLGLAARDLAASLDAPVPIKLRHYPLYVRAMLRREARPITMFRAAGRLVDAANRALDKHPDASHLMRLLTDAQADGTMTRQEAAATWVLLVIAGHETSANLITNTLYMLSAVPEQLEAVKADPDLIPAAIDESLRLEPVAPTTARVATTDVELPSGTVPAGTTVVCSLAAANRDPAVFADPDRFDIARTRTGNLGFGRGIHHCIGMHLARAEAEIALRHLLSVPLDIVGPVRWRNSYGTRGLDALPVRHASAH